MTDNGLKAHSYEHTGVKCFQCGVCEEYFRNISSLRDHLSVHRGVVNHQCTYCGDVFGDAAALQVYFL